ncbi:MULTISPECIES: hypothetical protein [Legionella]|uniref:Uncharacterized protein n=1 Tax=Legionella drozanskii LLAP-1 TaxID=1212489 RepID=A0A0W0SXG7_9GAMM|nr:MULTISPECIES: hypothetical protein [Legionella]KTC88009.1 hypothetical protein Ldro_1628 [Legionella drozanskii LLAP-1]
MDVYPEFVRASAIYGEEWAWDCYTAWYLLGFIIVVEPVMGAVNSNCCLQKMVVICKK